jgi:hypothetical protein
LTTYQAETALADAHATVFLARSIDGKLIINSELGNSTIAEKTYALLSITALRLLRSCNGGADERKSSEERESHFGGVLIWR